MGVIYYVIYYFVIHLIDKCTAVHYRGMWFCLVNANSESQATKPGDVYFVSQKLPHRAFRRPLC